ncbi:hypothetical protein WA158_006393 [Blastocystis sp. Blastoise]
MSIPLWLINDTTTKDQYEDPIEMHIKYISSASKSKNNSTKKSSHKIQLQVLNQEYILYASKSVLCTSEYFDNKFKNEWTTSSIVHVNLDSIRLVEAFAIVIKFMHLSEMKSSKSSSSDADIYNLNHGEGLEVELCVVSNMLCLTKLLSTCEQRLIQNITINTILPSIYYASTYSSKDVLRHCFKWILSHGVEMAYTNEQIENSDTSPKILYIPSKRLFYYRGYIAHADVFDALLLDRLALQSYYFTPGYLSSGPSPCLFDIQQCNGETPPGFLHTTRCYIERIKGLGEFQDIQKFNLYREDNNRYILTGIYIPRQNLVIFVNNRTITDYNTLNIYDNLIAYMKTNITGTEFHLYDNGINGKDIPECVFPDLIQRERCKIYYKSNLGGRVPNSMRVFLNIDLSSTTKNNNNDNNNNNKNNKDNNNAKTIITASNYREPDIPIGPITLVTKKASWNKEIKSWTLKFNQRSRAASKKNFQLIAQEDNEEQDPQVLLLLGKISSRRYSLDYATPLSSCQALAIAITAFFKKLLVA